MGLGAYVSGALGCPQFFSATGRHAAAAALADLLCQLAVPGLSLASCLSRTWRPHHARGIWRNHGVCVCNINHASEGAKFSSDKRPGFCSFPSFCCMVMSAHSGTECTPPCLVARCTGILCNQRAILTVHPWDSACTHGTEPAQLYAVLRHGHHCSAAADTPC